MNDIHRPLYLVLQPTAFNTSFTCQGFYTLLQPLLPFTTVSRVLYHIDHRLNLLLIRYRRILEHGGQRFANTSAVSLISQVVMRVLCMLIIS